ncbi:MAG: hypothetical protein WCP21_05520 [Armatimonadota bacterium]
MDTPVEGAGVVSPAATSDKIVFERGGDLFRMDADGTNSSRLTSTPQLELDPALAPDGNRLAFTDASGVWVMNSDGTGRSQVTTQGGVSGVCWSPDGQSLAFGTCKTAVSPGLYVVHADGSDRRRLTQSCDESPDWSHDGQYIVFSRAKRIYSLSAAGTDLKSLTPASRLDIAKEPVWAPNGQQIAFAGEWCNANYETVFLVNANGTGLRPVNARDLDARHPTWSPDGSRLAFYRYDERGLWVISSNGSGLRLLSGSRGHDHSPAWWTP